PVAGIVFAWPQPARHLVVEGRFVVRDGRLANVDEEALARDAHRVAGRVLAAGAGPAHRPVGAASSAAGGSVSTGGR
ncbi:MAG: hypothetical protein M0Z49_08435, partial [Chloroflexi bacterium]|nr:hypothetical protein [Chloroflexota bacterium]